MRISSKHLHIKMCSYIYKIVLILSVSITLIKCAPMTKKDGKEFLKKYGYIISDASTESDYEKSLKKFQETFSLPATGKLDIKTTKEMERPRCGHPDRLEIQNKQIIWNKKRLTYKLNNSPLNGLSTSTTRKEMKRAFQVWSDHIPLEFVEKLEGNVDIDITFYRTGGDGAGKTLAYAYFPRNGDVYFDNEDWTVRSERGFNLFMTAAHEIGHSLGLEHSMNKNALLYPYALPYDPNFKLHEDDITRIQDLYGKKESTSMNICDLNKIDSAFFSSKDKSVFIIKDNYIWKIKSGKLVSGYPKQITEEFKGGPSSIDAVYNFKDTIYFHQGKNVWKQDGQMKKINSDKKITTNIDAGLTYGDRTYVFKESQYWRYDKMEKQSGYPKTISSYWTGIPNSIDAVYYEDSSPFKFFYFFKGDRVYKFNMDERAMKQEMSLREYLKC